ncbi:hypothetical protein KSP40_PGU000141 [Platanthera guangdongensis]|uniref:Uncharacterized protein n=1 Tax=Platanthera guangdongensis TaxID=2320717 RepID=A0ABR2M7X6_9ASPA
MSISVPVDHHDDMVESPSLIESSEYLDSNSKSGCYNIVESNPMLIFSPFLEAVMLGEKEFDVDKCKDLQKMGNTLARGDNSLEFPDTIKDYSRRKHQLRRLQRFKVLSYNILADYLALDHQSNLYFHIPNHILAWEWRKKRLFIEFGLWSPDIMCLQVLVLAFDHYGPCIFAMQKSCVVREVGIEEMKILKVKIMKR